MEGGHGKEVKGRGKEVKGRGKEEDEKRNGMITMQHLQGVHLQDTPEISGPQKPLCHLCHHHLGR